jgi:two-component system, LuxR family, response regulator FixJ
MQTDARRRDAAKAIECLTARELEVLRGIVRGDSNKSIGRALGISPRTAEIHRANIRRKLSAASTADLIRIGLYAGIYDTEARAQSD